MNDEDDRRDKDAGDGRPFKLASSVDSTCSNSTSQTGAMTPTSQLTMTPGIRRRPPRRGLDQRRRALLRRITLWCAASASSFLLFLFFYLPMAALVSLLAFVSSTSMITYTLYLYLAAEFERILQERGLGDYLSQSIYNLLTERTLHEWMNDSSFTSEYRHLMLYLIPGISQEQLEAYIERLPPRHRNNLRRHGLGHLFGEAFMRAIMGNERYQIHVENQARPSEFLLPAPNSPLAVSRMLFDDSDDERSDLGLQITTDDMIDDTVVASRAVHVAPQDDLHSRDEPLARIVQVTTPAQDLQREQEEESTILVDAFATMSLSLVNQTLSSATSTAASIIEYISPIVIGSGLTVTSISVGVGLFGVWFGIYQPRRVVPSSPHFPSSRTLMGSTVIGGASAAFMYLVRSGVRSMIRSNRPNQIAKIEEDDHISK